MWIQTILRWLKIRQSGRKISKVLFYKLCKKILSKPFILPIMKTYNNAIIIKAVQFATNRLEE